MQLHINILIVHFSVAHAPFRLGGSVVPFPDHGCPCSHLVIGGAAQHVRCFAVTSLCVSTCFCPMQLSCQVIYHPASVICNKAFFGSTVQPQNTRLPGLLLIWTANMTSVFVKLGEELVCSGTLQADVGLFPNVSC